MSQEKISELTALFEGHSLLDHFVDVNKTFHLTIFPTSDRWLQSNELAVHAEFSKVVTQRVSFMIQRGTLP